MHEVVVTNPALAEFRIFSEASRGNDHGRDVLLEEIEGLVEAGAINRRWSAVVLSRAEDDDSVRGMQIVIPGFVDDSKTDMNDRSRHQEYSQKQRPQDPVARRTPVSCRCSHPRAKNSEITWAEIAPSRWIFQRASSSVRSTMVEATSRGEVPPSTMMAMRSWSWSRTASAVVHSDSPLRFAEVAVMGMPAACTTASGMAELGTRNATFPVLAVTFKGRREEARTIIVSGPGQNLRASA